MVFGGMKLPVCGPEARGIHSRSRAGIDLFLWKDPGT